MRQSIVLPGELVNHNLEGLRRLLLNQRLGNKATLHILLRIAAIHAVSTQILVAGLEIQVEFTYRAELHCNPYLN